MKIPRTPLVLLGTLTSVVLVTYFCGRLSSPYQVVRTDNRASEAMRAAVPSAECSSWFIADTAFMPDVALCKIPQGIEYCRAGAFTAPTCIEFASFKSARP